MRKQITRLCLILYVVGAPLPIIYGQELMTVAEQAAVIDSLVTALEENYVFPKVAVEMGKYLRQQQKAGVYQKLTNPVAFGDQLTTDVQSVSHDKHLRVRFDPEGAQNMRADQEEEEDDEQPDPEFLRQLQKDNFGFQEVKLLEGNVGYLDLRGFMPAEFAGETAAAVMNMLAHADAIIFDLRQNGGGSPSMIQLLTSYLYRATDRIHLNNFYYRPSNDTTQTWVLPYVPGARNPKAEVFVLTSNYTFSAAEEFTYNLQNLKRATVVGETTGGGAHPGGMRPIDQRFVAFVPIGRAINPITQTNWEGTGVTPNVAVPKEKALTTAHQLALEKLAEKAKTEKEQAYFNWFAAHLKAIAEPLVLKGEQLQACAGNFGSRSLIYEEGKLRYQRSGRAKMDLVALSATSFSLADDPSTRLSVELADGKAVALVMESVEGWKERMERTDVQP